MRNTPNQRLAKIRDTLVDILIQEGVITAKIVALDSAPIPANVKENNLKTSVKDRFDKDHWPKEDPETSLGIMVHYPRPFKKKICYFWGYRNHTIIDAETELLEKWEMYLPS